MLYLCSQNPYINFLLNILVCLRRIFYRIYYKKNDIINLNLILIVLLIKKVFIIFNSLKTYFIMKNTKKSILLIFILIVLISINSKAEGTKEFRPTSSDVGNLQVNDKSRPFAQESNTDPFHRLYFHINDANEKVYFGFQHIGAGNATFRIKNPSGVIVYSRTSIPSNGEGYIKSYEEAVAGPKIDHKPPKGYDPFEFIPNTTGDFYIEFTTDLSNAYHFDLFDLTVVDSNDDHIPGRLWSYAWDLNTRSSGGKYNGKFYVYTDDKFVSEADMNGIQPYGFVVSCNNTGPGDTPSGNNENRKSIEGNSTRPQYKIFLNDPDTIIYPSGVIPEIIDSLDVVRPVYYNDTVKFSINMSGQGTVEIIIDLNGTPGYQSGSTDVILVKNIHAGPDTIPWDGKDGNGDYLYQSTPTVIITSSFSSGITHLPLYDPETHLNGFLVNRIRPVTGSANLHWDDSNFDGGTVNIGDSLETGHSFPNNFGNERTMNTWWDSYKLNVLRDFEFSYDGVLPIELLFFDAKIKDDKVEITWSTASEINNDYFNIEKSLDGKNFEVIGSIDGAGTSNIQHDYSFIDENPVKCTAYYRLKQTDYDGKYEYSYIVAVLYVNKDTECKLNVYPNPCIEKCIFLLENCENTKFLIFDALGNVVYSFEPKELHKGSGSFTFNVKGNLKPGIYIARGVDSRVHTKKIIIK